MRELQRAQKRELLRDGILGHFAALNYLRPNLRHHFIYRDDLAARNLVSVLWMIYEDAELLQLRSVREPRKNLFEDIFVSRLKLLLVAPFPRLPCLRIY